MSLAPGTGEDAASPSQERATFPVPGTDPDLPGDAALLHILAQGDETALGPIHRRYAGRVLALARYHGLSDSEQAVEDAFVLLYRSAGCFSRSRLDAPTWIMALAHWYLRRASTPSPHPLDPEPTSRPDGWRRP